MSAFAIIAIKTGLTVNVFISTHIRLKSEVVAAGMLYRTDLPHSTACLLNPLPFLKVGRIVVLRQVNQAQLPLRSLPTQNSLAVSEITGVESTVQYQNGGHCGPVLPRGLGFGSLLEEILVRLLERLH